MHVLVFLLLFLPLSALAAEALTGDTIRTGDGRVVRLLGIKAPDGKTGDAAQAHLQELIAGKVLIFENGAADRYGRIVADVMAQPEKSNVLWLQGEMLRAGSAFVYPPAGTEPRLDELFAAEREARQTRRGIWSDPAYEDHVAEPPAMDYGSFAFVRGRVLKAERIKNRVYLNFGADWKTDFTIAIAAHDLHAFRKAGMDPLDYQGKLIRVRGWVKRDFGPMVTVTDPAQIEVLDSENRSRKTEVRN